MPANRAYRQSHPAQRLQHLAQTNAFMIYHPALSYFARDYGLHQIPIEAGGKEPSPAHLKALIDTLQRRKSARHLRATGI